MAQISILIRSRSFLFGLIRFYFISMCTLFWYPVYVGVCAAPTWPIRRTHFGACGGGGHNGRVRVFSVVDYLCMQYKPSLSLCVCLLFVCYSVTDGTVTLTLRG